MKKEEVTEAEPVFRQEAYDQNQGIKQHLRRPSANTYCTALCTVLLLDV